MPQPSAAPSIASTGGSGSATAPTGQTSHASPAIASAAPIQRRAAIASPASTAPANMVSCTPPKRISAPMPASMAR
jgi:hypothetical protein